MKFEENLFSKSMKFLLLICFTIVAVLLAAGLGKDALVWMGILVIAINSIGFVADIITAKIKEEK